MKTSIIALLLLSTAEAYRLRMMGTQKDSDYEQTLVADEDDAQKVNQWTVT